MTKTLMTLIAATAIVAISAPAALAQSAGESADQRLTDQNQQTTGPGNSTPAGPAAIEDPDDIIPTDPQEGPNVLGSDGLDSSASTGAASGDGGTDDSGPVDMPDDQYRPENE